MRIYSPVLETIQEIRGKFVKGFSEPSDTVAPPAVLTFPIRDYEGDFVQPDGGDWVDVPTVNWEHGIPVGIGANLELRRIKVNGEPWDVPVGQTQFFKSLDDVALADLNKYDAHDNVVGTWDPAECLDVAQQAAALVLGDVVTGVSVELKPIKFHKIGKSLLRANGKGSAYHFEQWQGLGWAHCSRPVNPRAGTVVVDKALAVLDRVGDSIHPILKKSLTTLIPQARPLFNGGIGGDMARLKKADMPGEELDMNPMVDVDVDMEAEAPMDDGMTHTTKLAYDSSQQILDMVMALREEVSKSEHMEGRNKLTDVLDRLEGAAEELQAIGDMVAADVGGAEAEVEVNVDEPEDLEVEEDGAIIPKSFPSYRAPRLKLSELGKITKGKKDTQFVEIPADQWDKIQKLLKRGKR